MTHRRAIFSAETYRIKHMSKRWTNVLACLCSVFMALPPCWCCAVISWNCSATRCESAPEEKALQSSKPCSSCCGEQAGSSAARECEKEPCPTCPENSPQNCPLCYRETLPVGLLVVHDGWDHFCYTIPSMDILCQAISHLEERAYPALDAWPPLHVLLCVWTC